MMSLTDPLLSSIDLDPSGSLSPSSVDTRPKSFLHDEMYEFNQIFSELVASPQRRFPFRDTALPTFKSPSSPSPSEADAQGFSSPVALSSATMKDESNTTSRGLLRIKSAPLGFDSRESTPKSATDSVLSVFETFQEENHSLSGEPVSCFPSDRNDGALAEVRETDIRTHLPPHHPSEGGCVTTAGACTATPSSSNGQGSKGFGSCHPEDGAKICDPVNEVIYLNQLIRSGEHRNIVLYFSIYIALLSA